MTVASCIEMSEKLLWVEDINYFGWLMAIEFVEKV
jgi:hypothetical protein